MQSNSSQQIMICCLNPNCQHPQNPDGTNFCISCGTGLVVLLRNRYRIIKPIGSGGFGRTYLAEDVDKLDEQCVVKQLAPQVQGSWALQKATELFYQEAKRLQQLGEHPQIPTLFAYFKEGNYLFLVQQFILGQNLLEELGQQGIFSEQKIQKLLRNLLPILQSVHSQQVIHRDIKPENIIRRQSDKKLVLIDFGVAKHATATVAAKPGTTIGSFGYAAIEQMQGGEAYPASDLYSLGATCFHLLTGINPWSLWQTQGYSWVQNWQMHLQYPISKELEQVLSKLLHIDRQLRYQSADEVLRALNSQPSPQPNVSPTISLPPRSVFAFPRWLLIIGFCATLIGTVFIGVSSFLNQDTSIQKGVSKIPSPRATNTSNPPKIASVAPSLADNSTTRVQNSSKTANCTIVVDDPNPPLNVRDSPEVKPDNDIGLLGNGTTLTVIAQTKGWVQINSPIQGWVAANRIKKLCNSSTTPALRSTNTSNPPKIASVASSLADNSTTRVQNSSKTANCTIVVDDPNPPLNVRDRPEVKPDNNIGSLNNGTTLTVITQRNGWVQINSPIQGWVASNRIKKVCNR